MGNSENKQFIDELSVKMNEVHKDKESLQKNILRTEINKREKTKTYEKKINKNMRKQKTKM